MKWLERIHIRSFSAHSFQQLQEALAHIRPSIAEENLLAFELLSHVELASDLAIILKWKGDMPEGGSNLGAELAYMLSDYGACDKSCWLINN